MFTLINIKLKRFSLYLLLAILLSPLTSVLANSKPENPLELNKKIVISFYNATLNDKNINAIPHYLSKDYRQHNPTAEDGRIGFIKFIEYLKKNFPYSHSEIKQVFADGDFVILHVHSIRVPGSRGRAIIDIFKLKNGKIIEHWDVVQDIPEISKNNNTMF